MKTIDQDIKTGNFKSVYLFYGEERYLLRQYRDRLKKAVLQDSDEMNFTVFEGNQFSVDEVIDLAETLPFFAERRVILIEGSGLFKRASKSGVSRNGSTDETGDADGIEPSADGESGPDAALQQDDGAGAKGSTKGKGRSAGTGGAAAQLADYLANIPETSCLIFTEETVDKRNRLYKAAVKYGTAVEFTRQKEETLSRWITQRVKREGKNITRGAYERFISKTGTDMENIDRELEKLLCYTLERDVITEADVEAVTTEQLENKIFVMIDLVAEHKQKEALGLYYDLLSLKEPPMRILYLIMRQFRILLVVKTMSSHGFSQKDIAAKADCPNWAVPRYQHQCSGLTYETIRQTLSAGADYEEAVKTGRLNDRMAVELLIAGICGS